MRRSRAAVISAVLPAIALAASLGACGSSSKGSVGGLSGSIRVLAASSLTKPFTDLAQRFESAHPDTEIKLDFGSSSTLEAQIEGGAPADVFASADQQSMQKLQDKGSVTGAPVVFAKNQMEIAVASGNPHHIAAVPDLAKKGVVVVLCASEAPCGKYADQLLEQDHVTLTPKSRELDARATLTKVTSGDADAAIVYLTDVEGAGSAVEGVEIPTGQNVVATLPIATLQDSDNAALAEAWVDFVTSRASEQQLQAQYGFLAP